MSNLFYPTGWKGKPENVDEFSLKILSIVKKAGESISYKEAGELIKKEGEKRKCSLQ